MRLSEDVIRYLTVKQEGPLPTPKASNKKASPSDDKEPEKSISESEEQPKAEKDVEKNVEKAEQKDPIPESKEN